MMSSSLGAWVGISIPGDYEKAMAEYLRARELNPNDAEVLAEMSISSSYVGQPKQAIAS